MSFVGETTEEKLGFVGRVLLEPVKEPGWFDRGLWRTRSDLIYKSSRHPGVVISIKVGFETDLSSVMRWVPLAWVLAGGTAVRGGVVHDHTYHHPAYFNGVRMMLPRWICDDIFDEINEEDKVPEWRRKLMWSGVRAFGWASYKNSEAMVQ